MGVGLRDFPCSDTAVDLGSRTSRIHLRGRGVVTRADSLLARSADTGRMVAAGTEAHALRSSGVPGLTFEHPFDCGVPVEPEPAAQLLRHLVRKAHGRRYLAKPRMAIAVPSVINKIQARAVHDLGFAAGARSLHLIPRPMAAAVGTGLRVDDIRPVVVADIGSTSTDVAVMAFGEIVQARVARIGGDTFDRAIVAAARDHHHIEISRETAEYAKKRIGWIRPHGRSRKDRMVVHGRDLRTGMPGRAILTAEDIDRAVTGPVGQIVDAIRSTLALCQPELSHDLLSGGVTLTGGGAQLRGLARTVQDSVGMTVRLAEAPGEAVVAGAASCLERGLRFSWRGQE